MPPRRKPQFDPQLEVIQREVQRLLAEYEARRGQNDNPTHTSDQEGEQEVEPSQRSASSEEEVRSERFGRTYHTRAPPPPHHQDYGVKVEVPAFEGGPDPDDFIDWLQEVDRILEYKEVPLDRQVKLVAIRLKKSASLWWENLKRSRQRAGKSKIVTREKMKKELQKKYLPNHNRKDVFCQLHHIQQGDLTVEA